MNLVASIAFLAFIALGLPDGILGVAWPSIRGTFGVPLDALGLLLAVAMTGYILSSFSCGKLLARMGIGALLAGSTLATALSLAAYAVLPSFGTMLVAGFMAGLGAGAVDSAINTYAAIRFRPRILNWLHASYSLGALLGPLIMAAVLGAGLEWRWGYAGVAGAQAGLAAVFAATWRYWELEPGAAGKVRHHGQASYRDTLGRGGAWLGMLVFFLYAGLEFSVGQWSFTLLSQGRGLEAGKAALWVSLFWGCFTGGRVLAGLFPWGDRVGLLLSLCPAGMVLAAVLILLGRNGPAAAAGLALMGLACAPVFPILVAITPRRLGARHVANAMGFQVAAATVGQAVVPGLVGVAAARLGLEAIAYAWLGSAFLVMAGLAALSRNQSSDLGAPAAELP